MFVPPSLAIRKAILDELGDLAGPAVLSPSFRRDLRRVYKRKLSQTLENNPFAAAARAYLLTLRKDTGPGEGSLRPQTRTLRDIEAAFNTDFEAMASHPDDFLKAIPPQSLGLGRREWRNLENALGSVI